MAKKVKVEIDEQLAKKWIEAIERELSSSQLQILPQKRSKLLHVLAEANSHSPIEPTPGSGVGIVFNSDVLSEDGESPIDSLRRLADAAEIVQRAGIPYSIGRSSKGYTYHNLKIEESPFVGEEE